MKQIIEGTKEVVNELKDGLQIGVKEIASPMIEVTSKWAGTLKKNKVTGPAIEVVAKASQPVVAVVSEVAGGIKEGTNELLLDLKDNALTNGTKEVCSEIFGCIKENTKDIASAVPKKVLNGFDSRGESLK